MKTETKTGKGNKMENINLACAVVNNMITDLTPKVFEDVYFRASRMYGIFDHLRDGKPIYRAQLKRFLQAQAEDLEAMAKRLNDYAAICREVLAEMNNETY